MTSDPTEAADTLREALLACWTSFESPGVDSPASESAAKWEQVSPPHTLPWRIHGHHVSDRAALRVEDLSAPKRRSASRLARAWRGVAGVRSSARPTPDGHLESLRRRAGGR